MPDERESAPAAAPPGDGGNAAFGGEQAGDTRSLVDDLDELLFDATTWFDAELTYQKTRVSFIGASFKRAIAFGVLGGLLAFFALIGLVVGLIIALTPLVTAWGATAIVVGLLLVGAWLAVRGASSAWRDLTEAVREDAPAKPGVSDNGE